MKILHAIGKVFPQMLNSREQSSHHTCRSPDCPKSLGSAPTWGISSNVAMIGPNLSLDEQVALRRDNHYWPAASRFQSLLIQMEPGRPQVIRSAARRRNDQATRMAPHPQVAHFAPGSLIQSDDKPQSTGNEENGGKFSRRERFQLLVVRLRQGASMVTGNQRRYL